MVVARARAAFPAAYREAQRHGDVDALDAALRGFAEGRVAEGDPGALFGALAALAAAFEAEEGSAAAAVAERELTRAMLPHGVLAALFQRLAEAPVTPGTARALSRALLRPGTRTLTTPRAPRTGRARAALRDALLPYQLQAGAGHEGGRSASS